MLSKIIEVKNLGKFTDSTACATAQFSKWSIVFGDNGRGKSTLTAMLKSIDEGNANHMLARQTLGQPDRPLAKLLFALPAATPPNPIATFDGQEWDKQPQPILVFDQGFIDDNVFIGGKVDYAQKLGLYEVFVGKQTGNLVEKTAEKDEQIRRLNTKVGDAQNSIRAHIKSGVTTDQFIGLERDESIDAAIKDLESQLSNIENKTKVLEAPILIPLIFNQPDFKDLALLLATSIETVSEATTKAVKKHIANVNEQTAEPWLEQGHKFCANTDGSCPFCGQSLDASDIAGLYGEYFNKDYLEALRKLSELKTELEQSLSIGPVLALSSQVVKNNTQMEYWAKTGVKQLDALDFKSDSLQSCLQELDKLVGAELDRKLKSPLEVITISKQLNDAMARLAEKQHEIEAYNEIVKTNNEKIKALRDGLRSSEDVTTIRSKLYKAQDTRTRHTSAVNTHCTEYTRLMSDKKKLEQEKAELRKQLDQSSQQLLEQHQEQINECLERSGADCRLERISQNHVGGRPNSTFVLKLNGEEIVADASAENAPSIRTVLSAGDKTTLAFAFFVSCAKHDAQLSSSVLAIDDPISSLDYYRRGYTLEVIYELFNSSEQGILLSHDADFLHGMWTLMGSDTSNRSSFQVKREGQGSSLKKWDVIKHSEAEQKSRVNTLQSFADSGLNEGQTLNDVISNIRPMLEHAYKAVYVKEFPSSSTLGEFVGKVRDLDVDYLANVKSRLTELTAVNAYVTPYSSHDAARPVPPVNDTELLTHVKLALKLMRS